MEKQGLKPCPYCGGKAEHLQKFDSDGKLCKVVACSNCWSSVHICETRENAIQAWNRRV